MNVQEIAKHVESIITDKRLALLIAGFLLTTAFSHDVREQILERDGEKCTKCGSEHYLQAAHTNHDKRKSDYDNPEQGKTLCRRCHYIDHQERAGANGLTKHENDWALKIMWDSMSKREQAGLRPPACYDGPVQLTLPLFATSGAD